MNTIDIRQAIIDIFEGKTPDNIQEFSGLTMRRSIEIHNLFKTECLLPREVKEFLKHTDEPTKED